MSSNVDEQMGKMKNTITARKRGSITIETAILLPFFIMAVVLFAFLIKTFYTYEIIQHAITEASEEMAVYSLLYYQTSAEELINGIEKLSGSEKVGDVMGNGEIASYIKRAGSNITDYVRAQIALVPMTKLLVRKNLGILNGIGEENRLLGLQVVNGFDGIDFSSSRMLADDRSIDIIAQYQIEFPFLAGILPRLKINQMASSCVWAGENGINKYSDEDQNVSSIWDMENIERGREIRRLQGATLPDKFPTIAKFINGTATSIKSLNIEDNYYQNPKQLKTKIVGYINKLEAFNGARYNEISVEGYQILMKELVLVMPEAESTASQQKVISECVAIAKSKGIQLNIVKAYGRESPVEIKNVKGVTVE